MSDTRDHRLVLINQEQMELTGVSRIESFNPEEILLETETGLMTIKGDALDIRNLNLEQKRVEIVGLITEIAYTGEKTGGIGKKGLLERIFK
jgi:sporulation protein YabP